jgi:hypothetical protein
VRKRQAATGLKDVEDFADKVAAYRQQFPDQVVLPAFLSLGGFTDEARQLCEARGIAIAERIVYLSSLTAKAP